MKLDQYLMKIKNKYKNSIVEIIEEDQDIENLTEGKKYYRVWEDGEFQLYEVPKVETDGSIIIQKDTILSVTDLTESNINIKSDDTENWEIEEVKHGPSLWGHDRLWMPPDQLKEARRVRSTAVDDNLRIPVNVMPGNYNLGIGQCPWWQKTKN